MTSWTQSGGKGFRDQSTKKSLSTKSVNDEGGGFTNCPQLRDTPFEDFVSQDKWRFNF